MKIPDLDLIVEQETDTHLEAAVTRMECLKTIFVHYLNKTDSATTANELYDLIRYICGFNKRLSHTKVFSDICGVYYQLGYTAEDIPPTKKMEGFTQFFTRGLRESLEYIIRQESRNA